MSSSTTTRTGGSSGGGAGGGGAVVNREVAKGVANLGNTCYMNAVLQALAHAPELCLAIDCEPHRAVCPTAKKNQERRKEEEENKKKNPPDNSNSSKGEEKKVVPEAAPEKGKAKKSKKGKGRSPPRTEEPEAAKDPFADDIFCALCEVERHLERAHAGDDTVEKGKTANGKNTPNPIAYPTTFVNGFISKVAPWFKRGVQEDSHEFLRLLIEAMQKSSTAARPGGADDDTLYPFKLFRGTVESNVRCSSCKANNSKVEFFEDIGLDVTPLPQSSDAGSTSQSSQSLADVTSALERFIHAENLDSAYKCESCGKLGRAIKQSFLHSIPPIVTLHLKRFRYGASNASSASNIPDEAFNTRRRQADHDFGGTTGSAKIEGHIRFDQVLDIRPYLTKTLQDKHRAMLCRLFAVVVHTGKNSHSGHYVAYVRNVAKNEWWRMDDARVSRATQAEVMGAEAYMLFYRVVDHPVAVQLRNKMKVQQQKMQQNISQDNKNNTATTPVESSQPSSSSTVPSSISTPKESSTSTSTATNTNNSPNTDNSTSKTTTRKRKREIPKYRTGEEWARVNTKILSPTHSSSSRDKATPNSYLTSKMLLAVLKRAEEFIAEHLEFKPEYFRLLTDEAAAASSSSPFNTSSGSKKKKLASGVTAAAAAEDSILKEVSVEDVKGNAEDFKRGLLDLFCQLAEASGGIDNFIIPQTTSDKNGGETVDLENEEERGGNLIVPVVETNETLV